MVLIIWFYSYSFFLFFSFWFFPDFTLSKSTLAYWKAYQLFLFASWHYWSKGLFINFLLTFCIGSFSVQRSWRSLHLCCLPWFNRKLNLLKAVWVLSFIWDLGFIWALALSSYLGNWVLLEYYDWVWVGNCAGGWC